MPQSWITIDAVMYGMMPRAKIEACENAPPENMSEKLHQAALVGETGQSVDVCGRDTRENHITAKPVYQYQQECYEDALDAALR